MPKSLSLADVNAANPDFKTVFTTATGTRFYGITPPAHWSSVPGLGQDPGDRPARDQLFRRHPKQPDHLEVVEPRQLPHEPEGNSSGLLAHPLLVRTNARPGRPGVNPFQYLDRPSNPGGLP